MSRYDAYDPPVRETRYYTREERRAPEPRYEEYSSRTQLVPRPTREDSDLSVEEVRRDFPPPGYTGSRDVRRARSAEPGYYEENYYHSRGGDYRDNRSVRDDPRDQRSRKAGSVYYEEEERTRKRVLNQQEKIIAAVVGGVLAAGAKEVWDRREAGREHSGDVHRNLAASAALAAGGALAGYQGAEVYNKHAGKEDKKSTYIMHKGRDGRVAEYYSDDDEDPRSKKSNKSFLESALSAAGLGGAIKALTGHDDRRSEGTRSRRGSPDSTRSRNDTANRMQKAAKASLVAGAAEAFRVSREPGGWQGEKMKRIITAAAGAATIDAAHNPDHDSKRHLVESVIGGLVGNRLLNGSANNIEEDRRTGRSRSRSRARSDGGGGGTGLAALATAGLGALGAKKLLDKGRDESRSRSRSRRGGSRDSYYDRDGSPRRQRSRSRSVVDSARRSLAKIGLGNGPDDRDDYEGSRASRRRRGYSPDDRYDDDYDSRGPYMRGGRGDDHDERSSRGARRRSRSTGRRSSSVSSSDLGDSDEDEKRAKKMKGKQLITAGLATVATIHAAHNVYSSMEKRNARHKAVKQGRLDPMEAKKLKSKALLQDAASIGIAAMGIKGAISEMKEAREITHECKEWEEEKQKRHQKRIERLQRGNSDYYGRSRSDNYNSQAPPRSNRYYDDGPRYADANPYSATLPAPPIGGYDRR
ncbi:hypothetical protein G7054_g13046 [Neopestalotiopsis clavispora]|nr:hypothetical protein G7054_g13046 [Neopestalotiopsis clavispora]